MANLDIVSPDEQFNCQGLELLAEMIELENAGAADQIAALLTAHYPLIAANAQIICRLSPGQKEIFEQFRHELSTRWGRTVASPESSSGGNAKKEKDAALAPPLGLPVPQPIVSQPAPPQKEGR